MSYRDPNKMLDNLIEKEKMHSVYAHKFAIQEQHIHKLQQRIDKAIKYIGSKEMYEDSFDTEVEKLLKILKGGSNE